MVNNVILKVRHLRHIIKSISSLDPFINHIYKSFEFKVFAEHASKKNHNNIRMIELSKAIALTKLNLFKKKNTTLK